MNGCDVMFDAETAEKVRAEVRGRMGGVCPCDDGRKCPLLPDDFAASLIPIQVVRPRMG